jgi:glutaminyl-tRNA synthetase
MHESPDGDKDTDFLKHLNPNSLTIRRGFLEPGLSSAQPGEHYQFQRLGYFSVDDDSKSGALIFNKTVGLRDNWAKQKKNQTRQVESKKQGVTTSQKSPVSRLQQLGKKYPNLPEEKQLRIKAELVALANEISYEELEGLFGTAVKKVGTRIATMIVLAEHIKNGLEKNDAINEFIDKAANDKNQLLFEEAKALEE